MARPSPRGRRWRSAPGRSRSSSPTASGSRRATASRGRDLATSDRLPARTPSRFLFGFLDGLTEGTYRVRNDRLGLAVRLSWPLDVFPCVWLWEEIAFTQDPPWSGQAYAVGIEPQAAYPGARHDRAAATRRPRPDRRPGGDPGRDRYPQRGARSMTGLHRDRARRTGLEATTRPGRTRVAPNRTDLKTGRTREPLGARRRA